MNISKWTELLRENCLCGRLASVSVTYHQLQSLCIKKLHLILSKSNMETLFYQMLPNTCRRTFFTWRFPGFVGLS